MRILLFSLPETAGTEALPIIWQLGIAGVLLVVLFYMVWRGAKYFTLKEKESQERCRLELSKKDEEIERLRVINKELTEQMLSQMSTYAQTLLAHEKDNLMSINDVTNSLNQLIVAIKDLQNK